MILKSSTLMIKILTPILIMGIVSACTATLNSDNNPFVRKLEWFSYIEGGDFRASCEMDRYRMIYNAVYNEQVRIYDITPATLKLHTRVINAANLKDLELIEKWQDMLDPWRGIALDTTLSTDDLATLIDDLDNAGAFAAPNVGTELSSKGFYWTIASCHNGQYHFTAFAWPSEKWSNLSFQNRLFELDSTGVPVNAPRKTMRSRFFGKPQRVGGHIQPNFYLKVGENGLAGLGSLF